MATVAELSDPYANFMLMPLAPEAPGVCRVCTTFTEGYDTCYPCGWNGRFTDAVLPISYSVHFGQLHTNLAGYKRGTGAVPARLRLQLAAVLWRFVVRHEVCLARHAGIDGFGLVMTVPSGSAQLGPWSRASLYGAAPMAEPDETKCLRANAGRAADRS